MYTHTHMHTHSHACIDVHTYKHKHAPTNMNKPNQVHICRYTTYTDTHSTRWVMVKHKMYEAEEISYSNVKKQIVKLVVY